MHKSIPISDLPYKYKLRSCFKIIQVSAGQGKYWREYAVYMRVSGHFDSIFNVVMCHLNNLQQLLNWTLLCIACSARRHSTMDSTRSLTVLIAPVTYSLRLTIASYSHYGKLIDCC